MAKPPSQLLGLDVGKVRIGVARASMAAGIAEPLVVIEADHAIDKLRELIEQTGAELLVVGLPRSLEGRETEQTTWTRQWAERTGSKLGLPIEFQDEALTSHLADGNDARAAVLILQDYLDLMTFKVDSGGPAS